MSAYKTQINLQSTKRTSNKKKLAGWALVGATSFLGYTAYQGYQDFRTAPVYLKA